LTWGPLRSRAPTAVPQTMESIDHTTLFAGCAFVGFLVFSSCTALAEKSLTALAPERRPYTAACVTALLNASCVSPLSIFASMGFLNAVPASGFDCSAGATNIFKMPTSTSGIIAVGLTCGYFMADTAMLIRFPEQMKKDLGGMTQYMIMWVHHVVSLIVWPYSMLAGTAAYFVLYFMLTEVTNVGMNIYLISREFKVKSETVIGIVWILSFFIVRILTVPHMLYVYYKLLSQGPGACGMGAIEFGVGMLTIPIPFGLNLFWFSLMAKKIMRMFTKSKSEKKRS